MKILIVYGTTEGQTRKIAEFIRDELEQHDTIVTLTDATQKPVSPDSFDGVIIGASVHAHKYQSSVAHYITEHHVLLNKLPSAFFSVSLTAAGDDKEAYTELEKITSDFLTSTSWTPSLIEQVAGALLYTKYDFFKRFIMRLIAKKSGGSTNTTEDYEYTDWAKVKAFSNKFITMVK
jgi:menaquinone-dependent protoporphyrinogen oxidase